VRVFRIGLPVADIALARAFYEAVLGIEADATVPTRLYFHCGDVIVALIDQTVEGRGAFTTSTEHLYLATDELDAVFERARTAGALERSPVETRPWGERSFYCTDPDGNRLCFVDAATLFLGRGADWA
jgi:catechol 2,3-dioxygenase-like lactoylglutathione lyase family enzyme